MVLTIAFLAAALLAMTATLFSRAITKGVKALESKCKGDSEPPEEHPRATQIITASNKPGAGLADLSLRAKKNIAWFLGKHARQISRIEATQPRIDLMTAENWLMRDVLTDLYRAHLQNGLSSKVLSYADGLGGDPELLMAASRFFNRVFRAHMTVKPEHIVVGAGCSAILDNLLYDICEQGDGVLIEVPFWGGFETSFVLRADVTAIHVAPPSFPHPLMTSSPDAFIDAYEKALRASRSLRQVKAVFLCNPHNPRGDVYCRRQVEALLRFCEKHNLHFISDEIYAMSEFCGARTSKAAVPFVSVLEMDLPALGVNPARVHMIYSISKDLGSSGLRLGFIVTQAHPDLRLSLAIANHAKVSTLTSTVVTRVLSDEDTLDEILHNNRMKLEARAKLIVEFLEFHGLEYTPPNAGVFIWARLAEAGCSWKEESDLSDRLDGVGVSLGAGEGYCAMQPGWFRICFAVPRLVLFEALSRIENALSVEKQWMPEQVELVSCEDGEL